MLVTSFTTHQGTLRAAALTYTTILSLIPLLAIAFAVLKGFGVQNSLEPLLSELAGDSEETIANIINYVNNTNFKSVGAVGLLALVFTVISLLGNIEDAFNAIWRVKETRPLKRRFSDYLSVVVVGPILLLVATSMTSGLQSQWLVQWLIQRTYFGDAILLLFRLVPYISIWTALTFTFIYIPNTRVKFRSALLGGIVAGTAWQIAQWGYFHFQVGVAKYNAIYGTLAALPIFLVWIYTSWLIVLLGVEIVSAHQTHRFGDAGLLPASLTPALREQLSLALLVQVCAHFRRGDALPAAAHLSDELGIPADLLMELLETLRGLGFLVLTSGSMPGWLPAREPSEVLVSELLAALRGKSADDPGAPATLHLAGDVIRMGSASTRADLDGVTLHDLVLRLEQPD
jgi:membrane protein